MSETTSGSPKKTKARRIKARGEFVWVNDGAQYPAQLVIPMKELEIDKLGSDDEVEVRYTSSGLYDWVEHGRIEYPKEEELASSIVTTRSPASRPSSKRLSSSARKNKTAAQSPVNTKGIETTNKPPMTQDSTSNNSNIAIATTGSTILPEKMTTQTPRKRPTPSTSTPKPEDHNESALPSDLPDDDKEDEQEPPAKRPKTDHVPRPNTSFLDMFTEPLVSAGKMIVSGLFGAPFSTNDK
ncbi:hypothetical protein IV203_025899 [Nitzschia inconspicua]|uniref:Uncharacterized protein n=1 Tax=Nitzschia inconspicua TaxID=303405 RepID=A0A9K3PWH1_9STRA|nr:hypothetical protein IV203_025899 [Nitzschia inconspicua]